MTTDSLTLPRRALAETDAPSTPSQSDNTQSDPHQRYLRPLGTSPLPRRRRRELGVAARLLHALLAEDDRRPHRDPSMLLGPNGGPIWVSRLR